MKYHSKSILKEESVYSGPQTMAGKARRQKASGARTQAQEMTSPSFRMSLPTLINLSTEVNRRYDQRLTSSK